VIRLIRDKKINRKIASQKWFVTETGKAMPQTGIGKIKRTSRRDKPHRTFPAGPQARHTHHNRVVMGGTKNPLKKKGKPLNKMRRKKSRW
jgi:hypothetical protein